MRILTGFGLLFAFVLMMAAVPAVSGLQVVGEALSGNNGLIFSHLTPFWLFLAITLGGASAVGFVVMLVKH